MAGTIFINYRRADARSDAARIYDRLVAAFGKSAVFMDVDDLRAGQRFDKELGKALSRCRVFLSVIGPRWLELLQQRQASGEQDLVQVEIAEALKRDILVIPVVIEHTPMPAADALPEDIRTLVLHQKHNVAHESFGRDLAALIDTIRVTLPEAHASPDRETHPVQERETRRKPLHVLAAVTMCISAFFLAAYASELWTKREYGGALLFFAFAGLSVYAAWIYWTGFNWGGKRRKR